MPRRVLRYENESREEFMKRIEELVSRSKEVRIKRNKDGTIKIKFRTPSYLYTYVTTDEEEARKILAIVPDELKREITRFLYR